MRVALVLPTGSRIATSRINFRLLAREALAHPAAGDRGRRTGRPRPRRLGRAARLRDGGEYEAALKDGTKGRAAEALGGAAALETTEAGPAPKSARGRARSGKGAPADDLAAVTTAAGVAAVTVAPPAMGSAATTGAVGRGGVPDLPVVTARDRSGGGGRRWVWIGISGLLVVALVVAAGWIAFNVLPTATITVVPRTQAAQPVNLTVIADPNATAVDTTSGVVPAQVVTIPLTATDTFNATGTKPVDTAATGTVTFMNCNTTPAIPSRRARWCPHRVASDSRPPRPSPFRGHEFGTPRRPGGRRGGRPPRVRAWGNVAAGAIAQFRLDRELPSRQFRELGRERTPRRRPVARTRSSR